MTNKYVEPPLFQYHSSPVSDANGFIYVVGLQSVPFWGQSVSHSRTDKGSTSFLSGSDVTPMYNEEFISGYKHMDTTDNDDVTRISCVTARKRAQTVRHELHPIAGARQRRRGRSEMFFHK